MFALLGTTACEASRAKRHAPSGPKHRLSQPLPDPIRQACASPQHQGLRQSRGGRGLPKPSTQACLLCARQKQRQAGLQGRTHPLNPAILATGALGGRLHPAAAAPAAELHFPQVRAVLQIEGRQAGGAQPQILQKQRQQPQQQKSIGSWAVQWARPGGKRLEHCPANFRSAVAYHEPGASCRFEVPQCRACQQHLPQQAAPRNAAA